MIGGFWVAGMSRLCCFMVLEFFFGKMFGFGDGGRLCFYIFMIVFNVYMVESVYFMLYIVYCNKKVVVFVLF